MENQLPQKILLNDLTNADRVAFYKKTYSHVAGGVLLFIMFEYLLLQSDTIIEFMLSMTDGYKWLIMLGGFMLVTNYAESTTMRTSDKNIQYLAYLIYIFAQALIFVPLIAIAAFYMDAGPAHYHQRPPCPHRPHQCLPFPGRPR